MVFARAAGYLSALLNFHCDFLLDRGPPVTPPPLGIFHGGYLNMALLQSGCLHLSCWG